MCWIDTERWPVDADAANDRAVRDRRISSRTCCTSCSSPSDASSVWRYADARRDIRMDAGVPVVILVGFQTTRTCTGSDLGLTSYLMVP